jgi:hypothetical protein
MNIGLSENEDITATQVTNNSSRNIFQHSPSLWGFRVVEMNTKAW